MNIDLELLKKQKLSFLHIIDTLEPTSELKADMDGILNLLDAVQDEQEDKFPNGFTSWIETHHEVVSAIAVQQQLEIGLSYHVACQRGTGGLYELAETLTDKFEAMHKDTEWDGEFYETIEEFLTEELKAKN